MIWKIDKCCQANPDEIWISIFGRGLLFIQVYVPYCSINEVLGNSLIRGTLYKEASNTLTSSQILIGVAGNNVKYNASTRITFTNGFRAYEGSNLKNYLTGCGGVVND